MPHGRLEVYVEGAVDIKDTNILGKGSPYCTLTMGSQEFSTPPIPEGGTRPFFNTNFEFQVDRTTQQMLVKIFSKKTLTDDDLLGYCTIVFRDAFYNSHVVPVTAYALTRPSGRPGGHIRLSLTFRATPRPAVRPPGLAGAYRPAPPRPAGPYRQPLPGPPVGGVGRGGPRPYSEEPSYRRQSHPVDSPNSPSRPEYVPRASQPYAAGNLPRRMNEEDSSSQSSESGRSDDGNGIPPAPYGAPVRRHPGPPPGVQSAQADRRRQSMPMQQQGPPPNNNGSFLGAFGGALVQNVVGAAVGAILNPDGEGSDWGGEGSEWGGGGDDEGSIGQVETASYGSGSAIEEVGYYEGGSSSGAVEEVDYDDDDGEMSQDAVGAPYNPGPPPPRGRGGPPVRGRAVPRGRAGPPVRGGAVPRGRAGPPGGRGGPPGGRGGVPIRGVPVRGRGPPRGGAPPSMARGGPYAPM